MNKLLLTTALMGTLLAASVTYGADDSGQAQTSAPAEENTHHSHMDDVVAKFPAADADLVHNSMKAIHQKNQPLFEKERKLREERRTIATADKFDSSAYLAKSADISKVETQIHDNMDKSFATTLAKLPVDERKQMVDSFTQHRDWHKGGEHGGHGEHHDAAAATTTAK